jgi:hypothetical protein
LNVEGIKGMNKLLIGGNELFKIFDDFNNNNKKNINQD